ncbi:MAG TPA: DUF1648 domain-containing protein [Gemmatimonadales bacterium]|jgi:uncharacterized membrane protein
MGRGVFGLLAGGFVLFVLFTFGKLPAVVASHFDGAGVPNGWSSRGTYTILLISIGVLLPLGIVVMVHRLTRRGGERLNIPARDYWLRPENVGEAVRRVRAYMWWLGCVMTATALGVHGLILAAHRSEPPRLSTPGILLVVGGTVGAITLWIAGWYRVLRRPSAAAGMRS